MAPQEGAIAWLDGWSLMQGRAKNVDQAYAFLELSCRRRKPRAAVAEGSGYNPVVTGADALLSEAAKKNFQEAYPGDALQKLWHRSAEPSWFGELRSAVRRQVQVGLSGLLNGPKILDSPGSSSRDCLVCSGSGDR